MTGALPLLLCRKNDVMNLMMTILPVRVSQYPSVHFSVRFLLLREKITAFTNPADDPVLMLG